MVQGNRPAVVGMGFGVVSLKSLFPGVAALPSESTKAVVAGDSNDALVCGVVDAPAQSLKKVLVTALGHTPDHVDPLMHSVRDVGWQIEDCPRISRWGQ